MIFCRSNFEVAKRKRLRNGIEAIVTVYNNFLHPRKEVCAKYPNANKGGVLNELLVVGQDEKKREYASADVCRHATRQF